MAAAFGGKYVQLDIREYDEMAASAVSGVWVRMKGQFRSITSKPMGLGRRQVGRGGDVKRWCDGKAPANREKFVAWMAMLLLDS